MKRGFKRKVIGFKGVNEEYGFFGNFGSRKLIYEGKEYKSCEGLFICMRFDDEAIKE